MNASDLVFARAAVVSAAIFLITLVAVWLDRMLYERRHLAVTRLIRTLSCEEGPQLTPAARQAWANSYLSGVGLRLIRRLAADTAMPPDVERAVCTHLLARLGLARVEHDAASHRGESTRWARIAALRVLAFGEPDRAWALLERALLDPDQEVAGAAVTLLGGMSDPRAAGLLLRALRAGSYSRSRISTFIDRSPLDLSAAIRPLLRHDSAALRYWGALLAARYRNDAGLLDDLAQLTTDHFPLVRRAALESLAETQAPAAATCARARLEDPNWVVRVHAIRALGTVHDLDAAPAIARSLGDREWWVRDAAKAVLTSMGERVTRHLMPLLTHADPFARNGAAEVLQNIGVFEQLLTQAADGRLVRGFRGPLEALARAGGEPMRQAVLARLAPELRERAESILDSFDRRHDGAVGA